MIMRALLAWLFALLVLGPGLTPAAHAAVLELRQAGVTAMAEGEAATRRTATLPYHWDRVHRTHSGEAVFELPFNLPGPVGQPYGVYFQRIGNSADIWLNGALLARLGDTTRPNADDFSKGPQYLAIAPSLLERENLFRIHIRADGGRRGGLSTLAVGPEDEVRALYDDAYQWRVSASLVVTVFSVLVGALALALWLTQSDPAQLQAHRRDNIYLAAGVAEFCWALRVGDVAIEQAPLAWPLWGVVVTAAFAGWFCCIALFCHQVAGWHRHRSMPWVRAVLWGLFGSSIVMSWLALTLHQPVLLTAWLGCANLLFIGYAAVYMASALAQPDRARLLVAVAGTLNVLMGVRDWVAIRLSDTYVDNTWIRYSSVLFGLVLGYIVITRFRAATAQARDLVANLAARVSEKERELQASYARVEGLAREQERASERARILRDMHDGVGAHISSAIRQLQSGRATDGQVLATLRDSLDQLKLSIDAMNLPPGDITALLANLRYRLEPRFAASDIELQWDVDLLAPLPGLDAAGMRQLQFMVYEALSNVLQHAQAGVLRIEAHGLGRGAGGLGGPGDGVDGEGGALVRIADNGRGFDTSAPPRKGLLSMRERAASIGARLVIDSGPAGTVVDILLGARDGVKK